jgi:hypothetical protein
VVRLGADAAAERAVSVAASRCWAGDSKVKEVLHEAFGGNFIRKLQC